MTLDIVAAEPEGPGAVLGRAPLAMNSHHCAVAVTSDCTVTGSAKPFMTRRPAGSNVQRVADSASCSVTSNSWGTAWSASRDARLTTEP